MLFRTLLEDILKNIISKGNSKNDKNKYSFITIPKMPKSVFLEVTNHCNLRCVMCTFHSERLPKILEKVPYRSKGFIKKELAFKIIDELGSSGEPIWLALHGAGEPLLHPEIENFVERASRYSNLNVGFLTNGMLLTSEKSKLLLDAGIRWLSVSIDGVNPGLMEKYRVGSNYTRIHNNFTKFVEFVRVKNINVDLHVNMTVQKEMEADIDEFVNYWLQYVDQVSISPCRPLGSRKSSLVPKEIKRTPCYMLFEMMVIYWDGLVGLCCEDWFNSGNMGSVERTTIHEVWHGRKYRAVRRFHERGEFHRIELCKDCDIWFNKIPQVEIDRNKNLKITKNAWQVIYERWKGESSAIQ